MHYFSIVLSQITKPSVQFLYFFENLLRKREPSERTPFFYKNFFWFQEGFSPFPWLRPWVLAFSARGLGMNAEQATVLEIGWEWFIGRLADGLRGVDVMEARAAEVWKCWMM